jgi:hypothetical protein
MPDKLFRNYTRGPAQSGVDNREISPLTGPLKPTSRPELQPTQPMNVEHAPSTKD